MEKTQNDEYVMGLKIFLGYDHIFIVELLGLSGGLATFWKGCYKIDVLQGDSCIIDLKVKMGSMVFLISWGLWGPGICGS